MNRTRLAILSLSAALVAAPMVVAHEAAKGRNGGMRVDAGKYHADKPIPAAGFKANAILVIDGKTQRFELVPAEGSKLAGTAPAAVKRGTKGAIQITAPDGTTAQAKY